jgi:hypothetical protein
MHARPRAYRPRTRALAAMLMLAALAGCSQDDAVTGPDQGLVPETGADMEGVDVSASAVPNYADGYVWASDPYVGSYTPDPSYSFNLSGRAITITRQGVGTYTVRFAGLSGVLGTKSTVHVTGYSTNGSYCKPATQKLQNDIIRIKCFDAATGRPIDAYYTVYITKRYGDLAFAYASKATGTNYAPPASASHNPAGAIRVFRSGVGNYQVKFSGLGARLTSNGGHVQVVAIGTGAQHCKVSSWVGTPDLTVYVQCYSRTGQLKDVKFNVFFTLPHGNLAYAWASDPSAPSYSANPFFRHNPNGGNVTVTRHAVGIYTVLWSSLSLSAKTDVQVTAYGPGSSVCTVEGWGAQSVNVRCFDPGTGAPVDSRFDIMYFS